MLSPRLGLSVSDGSLTLTGCVHVKDTGFVGIENMDCDDELEMFRYEVSVDGTGITEYYEFSEKKPKADVKSIWIHDVQERWGEKITVSFKGRIKVNKLWKTTKDNSSEVIALPPVTEDSEE